MLTVFEEMFWGDAGIALSILGTGLAAASLSGQRHPRATRRVAAADVRHSRRTPSSARSVRRSRAPAPTSARSAPAPATTRHPTSGFSTAPRPGPPTVESPTSTSWSRRCIPNWARADRPPSSSRPTPPGFTQGQKFKKHGIRASHTAEVVLDDVRMSGTADSRRPGEVRRADRLACSSPAQHRGPGRDEDVRAHPAHRRRDGLGVARAAYEYALDYACSASNSAARSAISRRSASSWPT